jgi:hypothetical protein
MKNWQITGFFSILILGLLLMSGCTSTGSTGTTAQPTAEPTVPITTTSVVTTPTATMVPTAPAVTPVSTTTQAAYSSNDINRHFVDVAFGPDYSYVNKWNKQLIGVAVTGTYNENDVKLLNDFFKL